MTPYDASRYWYTADFKYQTVVRGGTGGLRPENDGSKCFSAVGAEYSSDRSDDTSKKHEDSRGDGDHGYSAFGFNDSETKKSCYSEALLHG